MDTKTAPKPVAAAASGSDAPGQLVHYVAVGDLRADDDPDTCLRPLGLCELGGACDACWYRPDHPRFQK